MYVGKGDQNFNTLTTFPPRLSRFIQHYPGFFKSQCQLLDASELTYETRYINCACNGFQGKPTVFLQCVIRSLKLMALTITCIILLDNSIIMNQPPRVICHITITTLENDKFRNTQKIVNEVKFPNGYNDILYNNNSL